MLTQDEEERIKAEENMMEVGENENTIVKTPLDDKKTPRDDKTLQDVKIVIDDANKPGRVKLDKIIPRDKDGEGFLTPNGNAVLPSISVTPHLPKQEQEVIKGSSDDVVAKRKERADLAEVELALAEQALQIIKVRKGVYLLEILHFIIRQQRWNYMIPGKNFLQCNIRTLNSLVNPMSFS